MMNTGRVRLTEFWRLMTEQFGPSYVDSFARDYVMTQLGGRTVYQALADGESAKDVWHAVCVAVEVPESRR
jgi:hypothetical protein